MGDTGGMNKGFGFATFYNHTAALMTKKRLEEVVFGTVRPNIEFSKSQGPGGMGGGGGGMGGGGMGGYGQSDEPRSVYVGGLPAGGSESSAEASLRSLFQGFGEIERIGLPSTTNTIKFGFVHGCSPHAAH